MPASYTKLRDGSWGIRVDGAVTNGQSVTVHTKAGATKTETVRAVLWSGNGVSICAIQQSERPAGKSRGRRGGTRTGCSCGSVEEYTKDTDCWTCKHDAE